MEDNNTFNTRTSGRSPKERAARRGVLRNAVRVTWFYAKLGFKKVRRIFISELKSNTTPQKAAFSFSLGVFFGIFPIFGFQTVASVLFAKLLRLNRPIAVLGSLILLPFMIPIIFAAVWVGSIFFLSPDSATQNLKILMELFSENRSMFFVKSGKYIIVGCALLSILASAVAYLIAYPICKILKKKRPRI